MAKKKKGARIGNPVVRAATEAADRKRVVEAQKMAASRDREELPPRLIENDPLNEDDLDEADELMDAFMEEYPQWSVEGSSEQPWAVTSQIIRAFDGFVMWRKEAAEDGKTLDLSRCFEANSVTDVAPDVREFLIKHGLIKAQ